MKGVIDLIFSYLNETIFNRIKIESLKFYAHISEKSRKLALYFALVFLLLIIALSGFIFIHVAIFLLLPWNTETKAIILLALGFIYFFGICGLTLILHSRRRWARITGLKDYARKISSL